MMHVPAFRPACFTTGPATPRTPWAHDQGRGCGNATTPEDYTRLLRDTPGCDGCARAWHALDIHAGTAQALPAIRTGAAP